MKVARFKNGPEIFFSFQGEGENCGRPSVFVRLSGCNLSCVWCDTPYTWDSKRFNRAEETMELSVEEAARAVTAHGCKNVVLTGGEPMLQQRELAELMRRLKPEGYFFEVETNATILPSAEFDALIGQYNCSPKLANSSVALKLRERPEALKFFAKSAKANFKFVVANPADLDEILQLTNKCQALTGQSLTGRVFLMSEARTKQELAEKETWLTEICKQNGFFYSDRLHIRLYGDRRGV